MKLFEILSPPDPSDAEDVIRTSFQDNVVSDLVAKSSLEGDADAHQIIKDIKKQFPSIVNTARFTVSDTVDRIRIKFNQDGTGAEISVPSKLHPELGEILILHELAHLLYTKDLLCQKIVQYRNAPQAFTILRVLEDIAIERKLEAEFPKAVEIFKRRSPHARAAYDKNKPSKFSGALDQLFLFLRGYTTRPYLGGTAVLSAAETYLSSSDEDEKVDAVLTIAEQLMDFAS